MTIILYHIYQNFSFTTYIDRNLRPPIINIKKSEVQMVLYVDFRATGFEFYYMYISKSEVRPVKYLKKVILMWVHTARTPS